MKKLLFLPVILGLNACASQDLELTDQNAFTAPNKIVTHTVYRDKAIPNVHTSFGFENNPNILKAYRKFTQTGITKAIDEDGVKTLPYDPYAHPILACQPLRLCVVQLQRGESINNIQLGDAAHWQIATALVGSNEDGSYQISIKPKQFDIATDIVITTSKRTYNLGLISQKGQYTKIVNFYYPNEVIKTQPFKSSSTQTIDSMTTPLKQLNFNYRITGRTRWKPTRVFSDGHKTYIGMPESTAHRDLPLLYLKRQHDLALVNYRYQAPFYIVDTVIDTAILISGKGHSQERVIIQNRARG